MEIKSYKLPPLPNRKNVQIQMQFESQKLLMFNHLNSKSSQRPTSVSKQKKLQKNSSSSRISRIQRVGSARSSSRQSRNSNLSRDSSTENIYIKTHYDLKVRMSMPSITAKSWAIFQTKQEKYIYGKRMFKKRQIASLTKMVTLITIINILQTHSLSPNKIKLRVSREASYLIGTTAEIKHDMELTLQDLFYGMMLPSGNDAAYQIAQIGGAILIMNKEQGCVRKSVLYDVNSLTEYYQKLQKNVIVFLHQMNKTCRIAKMNNSHFVNPHGLSNTDNYSTAEDVCKLCIYGMKNVTFRDVVSTKKYECKYLQYLGQEKQNRSDQQPYEMILRWENTNKLLDCGWNGIKTGITPNAGPCLSASVKKVLGAKQYQFVVVLINSISMQARWKEVQQIVNWVIDTNLYY